MATLEGADNRGGGVKVIIDSREQAPFAFQGEVYAGTICEVGALQSGDYSLGGLIDRVAVERKSLPDLVACLGRERDRFERELQRARGLDAFLVVVEAPFEDLAKGNYRSQLRPHAACQSVMAFAARYRVGFHFAGSRAAAEYSCWSFLRQYLLGAERRLKEVVKAHGEAESAGKGAA